MAKKGRSSVALGVALLMVSGCLRVASPEQRIIRDAATAHLQLDIPIAEETVEASLEGSDAPLRVCWPKRRDVLADLVKGLVEVNRHTSVWSHQALTDRVTFEPRDDGSDHLQLSLPFVDGDQALIYVERHCPLCGFGRFILLDRRAGHWTVIDECEVWVS